MFLDIAFIILQLAKYYNKKRSIELTLKEGDKVYLLYKNVKIQQPSSKLDYKKLRPFRIEKVIELVNYQLAIPKSIKKYLVFYRSLLELALPSALNVLAMLTEIKDDKPYNVETVLDSKYVRHKLQYLIK